MSSSRSFPFLLAVVVALLSSAANGWAAPAAPKPGAVQPKAKPAAGKAPKPAVSADAGAPAVTSLALIGGSPAGPRHGRAQRDTNTCLTCHLSLPDKKLRRVAEQYQESVHRDARIGCAGCHKGDPTDPTVNAHDLARGFIAHPQHDRIAGICGGCHEKPSFIRSFNAKLPVDEYTLYKLSMHGKLTAAGDQGAPTCSDCHGIHDILAPSSPRSTVNRQNIVHLCGGCHANKKHMAAYDIPTDMVEKWNHSTHGKAFAGGSAAAPNCIGCHGPHAGTHPGTPSVTAACDYCHTEEKKFLLKSPHARAFQDRGLADCLPCHGHHDVVATSWTAGMAPDSACSKCHSKDKKQRAIALEISQLFDSVNKEQHAAVVEVTLAKQAGLYVPDADYALKKVTTAKQNLRVSTHSLDLVQLREQAATVENEADKAKKAVARARKAMAVQRRGYFVALVLAALLFVLLLVRALRLSRGRPRSEV